MGTVYEYQSRHRFGLAADMASIPAACRCAGDLYTQTDTKATYVFDGAAWKGPVPPDWVTAAMLKTDSVETLKIKNLNVTEGKLGPLACAEAKIGNLAISAGKLQTDSVETLKIKNLNVTIGKAALGFGRYVPRAAAAIDKAVGDFTTDGTWKVDGLDLSGIVPAGAVGVVLRLSTRDDAADSRFEIRQNATAIHSKLVTVTQVANIYREGQAVLAIDSNRLLDYQGSNLAFTNIDLIVLGWFT